MKCDACSESCSRVNTAVLESERKYVNNDRRCPHDYVIMSFNCSFILFFSEMNSESCVSILFLFRFHYMHASVVVRLECR